MKKSSARSGMTMLEVVIASVILICVVGVVFLLLFGASNEQATQQTMVHMDEQILQVLNRIAEEIRNGGGTFSFLDSGGADTAVPLAVHPNGFDSFYDDTVTPKYPLLMNYHTSLSFGINTGFTIVGKNGIANFNTTTVRFFWRYAFGEAADNQADDNSDGFVDEGDIVREETTAGVTTSTVICRNVARRGLVFQFPNQDNPPKAVIISMCLLGKDRKGNVMTRRSSLSAGPRT